MHHEAGVRTVTAGGRPSAGPMQAASGSRGAEYYSSDDLDADFEVAEDINATAVALLPSRIEDIFVLSAGINLRDQVRKDQNIPLQFLYEAANCRIFYTPHTFNNFTKLWKYAADAIWNKPELCVQGSTGYASTAKAPSTRSPPKGKESINANATHDIVNTFQLNKATGDLPPEFAGQEHDDSKLATASIGQACAEGSSCGSQGLACMRSTVCGRTANRCVRPCDSYHHSCGGNGCLFTTKDSANGQGFVKNFRKGYCPLSCPSRGGSDSATHISPPLPPTFESRPSDGGGGSRSGSRSRGSYKSGGTLGNYIKAGIA